MRAFGQPCIPPKSGVQLLYPRHYTLTGGVALATRRRTLVLADIRGSPACHGVLGRRDNFESCVDVESATVFWMADRSSNPWHVIEAGHNSSLCQSHVAPPSRRDACNPSRLRQSQDPQDKPAKHFERGGQATASNKSN